MLCGWIAGSAWVQTGEAIPETEKHSANPKISIEDAMILKKDKNKRLAAALSHAGVPHVTNREMELFEHMCKTLF